MKSVFLFGDSVFFGVGASSRSKGCGKLLKKNIDMPVFIRSHNLDTSEDGLRRLEKDVLLRDDSFCVIVMFGNNDCRLSNNNIPYVSLEKYKKNIIEMIRRIKLALKYPMLCNLQPISAEGFFKLFPDTRLQKNIYQSPDLWQKKYSDTCNDISEEEKIDLIDIRSVLEKERHLILAEDGLHPNDFGQKIIAAEIARALNCAGII
jgi:lysophospholipase L1-like esterase